jgi:cell wall-associated NlpC family hydrolase
MAPSIKTPIGNAPVIPVMLLGIGFYLMWFGVHYFKSDQKWPTDPIKTVLTGGTPASPTFQQEQQKTASLASYVSSAAAGAGGGPASGAGSGGIAGDAQQYVGAGYVWGGNASKVGDWDCSSFVSYVLGHDLGLPLPGGHWGDPGFPPHSHGPTTGSYALYGTQIEAGQLQPGDLVVWSTHIGIAIGGGQIVSARDEQEGTGISSISGTTQELGESVRYRRVPAGAGNAGSSSLGGTVNGGSNGNGLIFI